MFLIKEKKGQFFSLIVFLIIILAIVIFALIARLKNNEENFNIERLKKSVMNNFITDFDQVYMELIIKTALKPSVSEFLKNNLNPNNKLSKDKLKLIMKGIEVDGVMIDERLTINSTLKRSLGTITFAVENINEPDMFDFEIIEIKQESYEKIIFTFKIKYEFMMEESNWEKVNKIMEIEMDVYSLMHPEYQKIIDKEWIINNQGECYVQRVFSDAESCSGLNIMPPEEIIIIP